MVNYITNISSKVIAWLAFVATMVAIIGGMTMFDGRYARAADVQKTQAQMVQSIRLLNIDIQLMSLKNTKLELKGEKRALMLQVASTPSNIHLKLMLEEVKSDLDIVSDRIGALENKKVTE